MTPLTFLMASTAFSDACITGSIPVPITRKLPPPMAFLAWNFSSHKNSPPITGIRQNLRPLGWSEVGFNRFGIWKPSPKYRNWPPTTNSFLPLILLKHAEVGEVITHCPILFINCFPSPLAELANINTLTPGLPSGVLSVVPSIPASHPHMITEVPNPAMVTAEFKAHFWLIAVTKTRAPYILNASAKVSTISTSFMCTVPPPGYRDIHPQLHNY